MRDDRRFRRAAAALVLLSLASFALAAQPAPERAFLDAYKWRSIGPARGGRSIAAAGVKGRPLEAYFGAVGGGLWKTLDGGGSWSPVTDGQLASSSVGAVAVSESDPNVVFIGMGESCIRGNVMPGDGVYKSSDAGKTWSHSGFKGVDAIAKIRIHPSDARTVFVAAFGRYGVPSDERGLFKSSDGGATWKKVLFRDARTGAADVAIDPRDPRVMYASLWEAYRVEYRMSSGGPGSGLFKSTDGGETWTEITRNPGLPQGVVGKISVAVSGADSNRIYALVENANGGLFRSDDAGRSFTLVNDDRRARQRAFYYTHVHADTKDKDVVYMLNTAAFRSSDGGKTLAAIGGGTHGDHHDLWIDPDDPEHVVLANDGGGAVSFNVSSPKRSWSGQAFSTAQFYHVVTTRHLPFHVCGSQQDNTSLCVPSDTGEGGRAPGPGGGGGRVPPVAPYPVGGGEPGYIAPDPKDLDVFFAGTNNGGFLTRHNRRTGELKEVGAYPRFFSGEPASAVKERWQWTFPIVFSPADPNLLYTSSQRVWKSRDGGQTWEAISGDLTRHDPDTLKESGGPITHDMNSPEIYATVFALAPGRGDPNLLWAGSDDGLVHVTRDGGRSWSNVTPPEMPAFGRVSQIDAGLEPGTAYVAVKKMLLGDQRPHVFRTRDFGRSWARIVAGLPERDYVHAVRADPTRRGLLYAGTEHSFYVSFDDGERWQRLASGLPDTQVSDLWVDANAIAIATHGRGFYVLDDVAPLRQLDAAALAGSRLFKPADAVRGGSRAALSYWLKDAPTSLTLEILDARGALVRSYPGAAPAPKPAEGGDDEGPRRAPTRVPMAAGLNRFEWDLTTEPVSSFPGMVLWGATTSGPMVLPGTYEVRLSVDGARSSQPLVVARHPQRPIPDEELRIQFDMASRIRDKVNEANAAVVRIRRIKKDVADRLEKSRDSDLRAAGERVSKSLSAVEEDLYQVRNRSNQDPLNFPIKTNNRLASLLRVVLTGEGVPTSNVGPIFEDLKTELQAELDRLQRALAADLPPFNNAARRLGLEPVGDQ